MVGYKKKKFLPVGDSQEKRGDSKTVHQRNATKASRGNCVGGEHRWGSLGETRGAGKLGQGDGVEPNVMGRDEPKRHLHGGKKKTDPTELRVDVPGRGGRGGGRSPACRRSIGGETGVIGVLRGGHGEEQKKKKALSCQPTSNTVGKPYTEWGKKK